MTCRRCNGTKNVAHYINDFFGGWFCPACVDVLCNEVADAYVGLPTVREGRESGVLVTGGNAEADQ